MVDTLDIGRLPRDVGAWKKAVAKSSVNRARRRKKAGRRRQRRPKATLATEQEQRNEALRQRRKSELLAAARKQPDDAARVPTDGDVDAIFNRRGAKRVQMWLDPHQRPLVAHLISVLDRFVPPGIVPTDPVLLFSFPGSPAQQEHCDYRPDRSSISPGDPFPESGLLFARHDGTRLYIYRKSHLFVRSPPAGPVPLMTRELVVLNKGDAMFFRGDAIHGGADYPVELFPEGNDRIHVFLDKATKPRPADVTFRPREDKMFYGPEERSFWCEHLVRPHRYALRSKST